MGGYGGSWADEMAASSPVHFFRRNPTDRPAEVAGTAKNDYFLEDPHTLEEIDFTVTMLAGSGDDKVYYIDGNLWLHSGGSMSFKLRDDAGSPVRVVFVVRGNVYFGDSFYYDDSTTDAVAFIALKDELVPDSGNIYFGDPLFGTLDSLNAFTYAENNFYDNNYDPGGMEINGTMSAGNQVLINRAVTGSHAALRLNYDNRIESGLLTLSGLPGSVTTPLPPVVVTWSEVGS